MKPIRELRPGRCPPLDALTGAAEPVVLRGLVADWPAVQAAAAGRLPAYLAGFDTGEAASCMLGPPEIAGRFFYRPDMSAFNFNVRNATVSQVLDQLALQAGKPAPLAIAMQSAPTDDVLPGFEEANRLALLPATVRPRIWIGNAVATAPHFDPSENIACVVAGRRRFTLFPPDQLPNMYLGPLQATPAGVPVSMVDPERPDLDRYPRFADALAAAQMAELGPGDAIYVPYMWWHAVRSLDPLSVLVNYWWDDAGTGLEFVALLHALLAMRTLSPTRRAIWRGLFDHLAFRANGDPAAHLPPAVRGALGPMPEDQRRELVGRILTALTGSVGGAAPD